MVIKEQWNYSPWVWFVFSDSCLDWTWRKSLAMKAEEVEVKNETAYLTATNTEYKFLFQRTPWYFFHGLQIFLSAGFGTSCYVLPLSIRTRRFTFILSTVWWLTSLTGWDGTKPAGAYQRTADRERKNETIGRTGLVHFLCELQSSFSRCVWCTAGNTHTAEDRLSTKKTLLSALLLLLSRIRRQTVTEYKRLCATQPWTVDLPNQVNIFWCHIRRAV